MEEEDHTVSRAKDHPGGQVQRMGERLYDAFWRRQPGDRFTPFEGQAEAIRNMWFGIASDALALTALSHQQPHDQIREGEGGNV